MDWLTQPLFDLFKWVMDPARLVAAGMKMFGAMVWALGWIIEQVDPAVGQQFQNIGTKMGEAPISELFSLMLYMADPLVDQAIFRSCIAIVINAWLLSLVLRLCIIVKAHVWPGPA